MSDVIYTEGNRTITIEGMDDVRRALGDLEKKAPAAVKVAINSTAREARKMMVAQAKARYAVNAAGRRHLNDLVQRKKATNKSLSTELHIRSFRNDLAYFHHSPTTPFPGEAVRRAPKFFKANVLKNEPMKRLNGGSDSKGYRVSKGFLVKFKSGHVGMVQRIIGSHSAHTVTERGYPRWRNKNGQVEKLVTMGSPSAAAMHNTIWPAVEPDVEVYLQNRLTQQVQRILVREAQKARRSPK